MLPIQLRFANLKKAVSITSVLADKGLIPHFKKRGDQLFGPCPVHGGDNPGAFVVSLSKNLWYCFTDCNTGGDVVRLAQLLNRSSYAQTALYLASLANHPPVPWDNTPGSVDHAFQPFTRRVDLDPSAPWFRQKGIHPQTARAFESGAYHGPGFLADCVAVRLHDASGNPIGYAGRRMNTGEVQHGKWKFPRSLPKKSILYNLHRVNVSTPCLIVVECPWGVMRLAQLGIPAVALLGIQVSPIQLDILIRFPRLILMLDGDHAGRTASAQIQRSLACSTDAHQAFLPQGKDPDDLSDDQLIALSGYFSL